MKYVEPEMEVVVWDATIFTNSITVASNESGTGNDVFGIDGSEM